MRISKLMVKLMEFANTADLSSDVARSRMNGQKLHQSGDLFRPPKPSCKIHIISRSKSKIEIQKTSLRRIISALYLMVSSPSPSVRRLHLASPSCQTPPSRRLSKVTAGVVHLVLSSGLRPVIFRCRYSLGL
jgi:hypothetical protein